MFSLSKVVLSKALQRACLLNLLPARVGGSKCNTIRQGWCGPQAQQRTRPCLIVLQARGDDVPQFFLKWGGNRTFAMHFLALHSCLKAAKDFRFPECALICKRDIISHLPVISAQAFVTLHLAVATAQPMTFFPLICANPIHPRCVVSTYQTGRARFAQERGG
ncbi:hypothetical protein GGR95_000379 [Sulfitobacter undariae]|uniref:Uncharacterized protein n=1 Tax=Sulfitobacter undariae TaxID=1563671 RepID=A0A7W6E659_9RHOB|nr:hypothetical protein [Sulfitobacter undariae]